MNNIQIFNNPLFGNLRTVIINEKEYFFGVDIAVSLMYKRPRKAVTDNCKGILTEDTIKNNGGYPELLIPEGDIYRLIIKAGQQANSTEIKEKADKLDKWIFDDVLPQLRKTGSYGTPKLPQTPMELLELHYEAIKQVDSKVNSLEERFNDFEQSLPLLPEDADDVSKEVKKRVVEVLGGKDSNAYHDKSLSQKVFKDAYRNLKGNFDVSSYKAIKRNRKQIAVQIAREYRPPIYLAEQIKNENAQYNFI